MLRNREIQMVLLLMCSIGLAAIVAAAFISPVAAALVFVTSVLLIGSSLGELSILKNDIYKVTLMLSEHRSLLQQDKIQLTDAISDISHQLKTPLTSMTVMADLLSDPHLPPAKRTEFTRNIRIQLERIDWLVSSLLKLSKIDAGTVPFKKDRVKITELIRKALEPVAIPMEIQEQTVSIQGDDGAAFVGDFNWTAEAVINILKNAVEHTEEGGAIAISYSENALFTEWQSIADQGEWHVLYQNVNKEQLAAIRNDDATKAVAITNDLGYAFLEGGQSINKPYLFVKEYNAQGFAQFPVELSEGRLPQTNEEVVISEAVAASNNPCCSRRKASISIFKRRTQ